MRSIRGDFLKPDSALQLKDDIYIAGEESMMAVRKKSTISFAFDQKNSGSVFQRERRNKSTLPRIKGANERSLKALVDPDFDFNLRSRNSKSNLDSVPNSAFKMRNFSLQHSAAPTPKIDRSISMLHSDHQSVV